MQDEMDQYQNDASRDADVELPDDLDPSEMAESIEDELIAEEGMELGLDPDLAIYAASEDLPLDEDEGTSFQ
jgi:hypothetical protein